jgi:mono/diheme cytochrome c family protein
VKVGLGPLKNFLTFARSRGFRIVSRGVKPQRAKRGDFVTALLRLAGSITVGVVLLSGCGPSMAQAQGTPPEMADADAARGRALFARKGGVACHAVNESGGTSAPPLNVASPPGEVDPLDFVARMWRGAEPMVMMQQSLFGAQLDFTGQELADIIAFAHDPEEQRKFSEADVPQALRRVIREQ